MIPGSESSPGEGIGYPLQYSWACLVAQMLKICLQCGRHGFHPWVGKICWRRAWQPLQYSCLENPHGQRSLAGYSPSGLKELDMTERLSTAQLRKLGKVFQNLSIIFLECKTKLILKMTAPNTQV